MEHNAPYNATVYQMTVVTDRQVYVAVNPALLVYLMTKSTTDGLDLHVKLVRKYEFNENFFQK